MIYRQHLRELVEDTLHELELYSKDAVELILGTIAQESAGGHFLKQLKNGPAKGICQVEPNTHYDIWQNYLKYKDNLRGKIDKLAATRVERFEVGVITMPIHEELVYNLKYAIAICRIHYLRVTTKLPSNLDGWAKYWKDHYNTHLGKGTQEEFIKNYKKYVL